MMGDIPIFVAHHSADVWSRPDLWHLDSDGNPSVQAGVPPDYFSATGQLWGNPIYRWDAMAAEGYSWWIDAAASGHGSSGSLPRIRSLLVGSKTRNHGRQRALG
jgi:4-alpha-glucanotransferase